VTPSSGTGLNQPFAFLFSDPAGYADMQWQQVLISANGSMANACFFYYSPSNSMIYLGNDAGNGIAGSQTLGAAGTLQNSQCSLNVGSSSTLGSGNNMTLDLAITFQPSFTGPKNIWAVIASSSGQNSGWQYLGTWTP
jgi:hypothetical protein